MVKQLGWCVALLVMAPVGIEAQEASIQVRVRIVKPIETQRVVPSTQQETAGVVAVPASWRWEVRATAGGAEEPASWSSAPLAAGRGGEAGPLQYAIEDESVTDVSYLFAPI